MAIKTSKISDWLSANGQAVTNASLNTMKPYLEKNMACLLYTSNISSGGGGNPSSENTGNENTDTKEESEVNNE